MNRWWSKPGLFTKAGQVTIRRPGAAPYEVPAYTYSEFRKIVAGGRIERDRLQARATRPTNAQVRRGDVHRVPGAGQGAESIE